MAWPTRTNGAERKSAKVWSEALAFVDHLELMGGLAQTEAQEADGAEEQEENGAVDDVVAKVVQAPDEQADGAMKPTAYTKEKVPLSERDLTRRLGL
jgi:hypothetical protein